MPTLTTTAYDTSAANIANSPVTRSADGFIARDGEWWPDPGAANDNSYLPVAFNFTDVQAADPSFVTSETPDVINIEKWILAQTPGTIKEGQTIVYTSPLTRKFVMPVLIKPDGGLTVNVPDYSQPYTYTVSGTALNTATSAGAFSPATSFYHSDNDGVITPYTISNAGGLLTGEFHSESTADNSTVPAGTF